MTAAAGTWRSWSYSEWNRRLVRHVLVSHVVADVTRIHASPEALWSIAGEPPDSQDDVAAWFCRVVAEKLYQGGNAKGFCGFAASGNWSPASVTEPHFFAQLWLTCLVASGFPEVEQGEFAERLRHEYALGRTEQFRHNEGTCLPALWEKMAAWSAARHVARDDVRRLRLPPPCRLRTVIGYSHFLAFPNRHDRIVLAQVLGGAGLLGYEPPIRPVLKVLLASARQFSKEFREDLNEFSREFQNGTDPRHSSFWRAVREEALSPSVTEAASGVMSPRPPTQLRFVTDEELLLPVLACKASLTPPEGFHLREIEGWEGLPLSLEAVDGGCDGIRELVFDRQELIDIGTANLIRQGLLGLRAIGSDEYEPTAGAELEECDLALVRADLCNAVVNLFSGNPEPTGINGWIAIRNCKLHLVDDLPVELGAVVQLQRAMVEPRVRVVGGVRIDDAFLNHASCLPRISVTGAKSVTIRDGEAVDRSCAGSPGTADWILPNDLPDGTYNVVATRATATPFEDPIATAKLVLVDHSFSTSYRGAPSGAHRIECCCPEERSFAGPGHVPLMITSQERVRSADLLQLDSTLRYLGPGLGEMSLDKASAFQWAAIGPKKHPEALVFLGDADSPVRPAQRRSPADGDRRHWRSAFNNARAVVWRRADGTYANIDSAPELLKEAYRWYRSHKVPSSAEPCIATGLESHDWWVTEEVENEAAIQALDVIAALSCRRRGLTYPTARDYFGGVVGSKNPFLFNQVLRAWSECGIVDQLRGAVIGLRTIVMRRPHFVLVQRGPLVDATLVGWLPSSSKNDLERNAKSLGVSISWLRSPSIYQPSIPRLCGTRPELVSDLSLLLALEPPEWLLWETESVFPDVFDVASTLNQLTEGEPPESFRVDALWDWSSGVFRHDVRTRDDSVTLERRLHKDMTTLYVIRVSGSAPRWTYSREWAVLAAHIFRGRRPFKRIANGIAAVAEHRFVHLPLPLGRLCTLVGQALPGPRFGAGHDVESYVYPFGKRLESLVRQIVPSEWISD